MGESWLAKIKVNIICQVNSIFFLMLTGECWLACLAVSLFPDGMMDHAARFRWQRGIWMALPGGLFLVSFLSLSIGSAQIGLGRVLEILFSVGSSGESMESTIVWSLRLPRVLMGVLLGASLATAGALLQGFFRNPLADPALIGISGGAAVGALSALLFASALGWSGAGALAGLLPVSAAIGALLTTFLVFRIASQHGRLDVARMLLAGIAINALAGSFLGLGVAFADDAQLRAFTFWTLGSLAQSSPSQLLTAALFMFPALALAPFLAQRLNLLLLGEAQAAHLGLNLSFVRLAVVSLSAVLAGTAVALCGIVSFVGLLAPHSMRLLLGGDHRRLLPAAMFAGAILTVAADLLARTLLAPNELPLGALTALAGGPFFLFLLVRQNIRGF
jgi:iron complex transport system permease protein